LPLPLLLVLLLGHCQSPSVAALSQLLSRHPLPWLLSSCLRQAQMVLLLLLMLAHAPDPWPRL
jgi:hypothetical protein